MSDARVPLEKILRLNLKSMSFESALAGAVEDLSGMPGILEAAKVLKAEHQERINEQTKFTQIGTAQRRDLKEIGWYQGDSDDSGVWASLRARMLSSRLASAELEIDRSSDLIIASCAEPYALDDRRLGLVIGNVQSGKTANYSAVIAKALDSGYKFVIVLSGIHNNLRRQTQERLERDLGVRDDQDDWYRLTSAEGDFGKHVLGNQGAILANHDRIIAVIKKNGRRLRNLLDFFNAIDSRTKQTTPILIIDDESDQATPDGSQSVDSTPTVINGLMRELWHQVSNGTYIGYTATPFANVFMDPDIPEDGVLPELYPRDFIHVMPTPDNYFGAESIFGLAYAPDDEDPSVPDVVRTVAPWEVALVSPTGRQMAGVPPMVTPSLGDAIKWFVVATAVRIARGQASEHSTMLIHTTNRVDPHFQMKEAVLNYLDPLKKEAREGRLDEFKGVFHDEFDRAAELLSERGGAVSWYVVSKEIPNVLRSIRVVVDNGSETAERRLSYSADKPETVIVIGGGTLSRGLTLEGLFVSFFTRTSNTYDTLLQMGRWFGYRPGYEDLQRVWLSEGLDDDYRFLASIEAEVRTDVQRLISSKRTPEEIGIRVRLHPGRLQITSPAKMKYVSSAGSAFDGHRLQTTLFDVRSTDLVEHNFTTAAELITNLQRFQSSSSERLFEDVPIGELHKFFSEFRVHDRFRDVFDGIYKWSRDQLPDKRWNVVIQSSSTSREMFRLGDNPVKGVRRSPILRTEEELSATGEINIRALMTGEDLLADLKLSEAENSGEGRSIDSRLPNAEQLRVRMDKSVLDGRGLLILYPIGIQSLPTNPQRMGMKQAISFINPDLATRDDVPLMAVALVAPMDTDGVVRNKASYVSVKPVFGEVDDDLTDEERTSDDDTEIDFEGDLD